MPLFDPKKLLVLAGPCSLENEKVVRAVAEKLVAVRAKYPELNLVFKGSFDKANRTSISGGRGTGLEAGLALHALVKKDYGLPCVTDVHESDQCSAARPTCSSRRPRRARWST
jgi:2-dehydro-3-deoxyphosphooctonate aldolase (KDO 8-P synthase)